MTGWLDASVVPMAWCWTITRCDGVMLGLTTHDRDLMIDDLAYRSAPGIRLSSIRQSAGFAGDVMDIEGALSGDAITAADLAAGRWDGARVDLFVADWEAPAVNRQPVASGVLGAVTLMGESFAAELNAARGALDEPLVPETSAECRAELGDARCGVMLARWTSRAVVASVAGDVVTLSGVAPAGLRYGRLRWLDGASRGLASIIAEQNGNVLRLAIAPAAVVATGARVELIAGCDKRVATCASRFANALNFRGEPHLPGIDLLTRYPGG
jgi:uncharacterized phage protein (TIGR02218 family)